jgi:hypothetical protein
MYKTRVSRYQRESMARLDTARKWTFHRCLLGAALLWTMALSASSQAPAKLHCEPECRRGFTCSFGECVPLCEPACGTGFVCSEQGSCLPEGAGSALMSQQPGSPVSPTQGCQPSCRQGYVCIDRSCVSACNPPCANGQLCSPDGQCVFEPPPPPQVSARPRSSTADSIVNLHINALGMLQFGLAPTLEMGTWIAGYLSVQPLNTGVGSYYLLQRDTEDRLRWGLGSTLGVHLFTAGEGNMRGAYGGLAVSYFYLDNKDEKVDRARLGTHAILPQVDGGYRWALDHFLLGVGGRVGLSLPVSASDRPIGLFGCTRARSCDEKRHVRVLGELVLDVGYLF